MTWNGPFEVRRPGTAWIRTLPFPRVLLSAATLFGAAGGLVHAAPVLDQENLTDNLGRLGGQGIGCFDPGAGAPDPTCGIYDWQDAQTFTVGVAGLLARVDVPVRQNLVDPNTELVTLEIRPVKSGVPDPDDDALLGAVSLRTPAFAGVDPLDPTTWPSFDVSGLGIQVSAGEVLAYSVRTADPAPYNYVVEFGNDYTAGQAFRRNRPQDPEWLATEEFLFRTYVDPDTDNDGVGEGSDRCAGTVVPEEVPTRALGVNRYALTAGGDRVTFSTTAPAGQGPRRSFTIDDTAGCSCEQILTALHDGEGHEKFGCSIGVMERWVTMVTGKP